MSILFSFTFGDNSARKTCLKIEERNDSERSCVSRLMEKYVMPVADTQSDSASFSRVHCSTLDRMLHVHEVLFLDAQL